MEEEEGGGPKIINQPSMRMEGERMQHETCQSGLTDESSSGSTLMTVVNVQVCHLQKFFNSFADDFDDEDLC